MCITILKEEPNNRCTATESTYVLLRTEVAKISMGREGPHRARCGTMGLQHHLTMTFPTLNQSVHRQVTSDEAVLELAASKEKLSISNPGLTAKNNQRHFVKHNYHDHSHEEPNLAEAMKPSSLTNDHEDYHSRGRHSRKGRGFGSRRRGGVSIPFPEKLHTMLDLIEADGHGDVVSWQPHGRAFAVHKSKKFVSEIMPKYFRQSKISSFQRQLNLYGFCRLTRGQDKGAYYHELFLKGKAFLCNRMARTRVKGTGIKASSSPESEPNFYTMPSVEAGMDLSHKNSSYEMQTISTIPAINSAMEATNALSLQGDATAYKSCAILSAPAEELATTDTLAYNNMTLPVAPDHDANDLDHDSEDLDNDEDGLPSVTSTKIHKETFWGSEIPVVDFVPVLNPASDMVDKAASSSSFYDDWDFDYDDQKAVKYTLNTLHKPSIVHLKTEAGVKQDPQDLVSRSPMVAEKPLPHVNHYQCMCTNVNNDVSLTDAEKMDEHAMDAFFDDLEMGSSSFNLERDDDECLGGLLDHIADSC